MPAPIKRYYPVLSDVVTINDFPEKLEFIKLRLVGLLEQIYYKRPAGIEKRAWRLGIQ